MKRQYICTDATKQFDMMLDILRGCNILAVDTETTGLSVNDDRLCLIQIATVSRAYLIHYSFMDRNSLYRLMDVINRKSITWIIHNAKFDLQFFMAEGIDAIHAKVYDTMLAETCILQGRAKGEISLKKLVQKYCGVVLDKEQQTSQWDCRLSDEQKAYAVNDVKYLRKIRKMQGNIIREKGLWDVVNLENRAVKVSARLELNGVFLDKARATKLLQDYNDKLRWYKSLFDDMGFNPNSPRQVKEYLRGIGIEVKDTTKTTLADYPDNQTIMDILDYKSLSKKTKSVENLIRAVNRNTKRIHASYIQNMTSTGRYSCSSPNLQGIPHDKAVRSLITAPKGRMFVICDYSQAELRLMAEIANDKKMKEVYRKGHDLHTATASMVNNIPYDKVTEQQRKSAKAMNFGLIYGMSARTFVKYAKGNYGVTLSLSQALDMKGMFFEKYWGVFNRIDDMKWKTTLHERSLADRLREWKKLPSMNVRCNYAIQSTGADILKYAFALLEKHILRTGMADIVLTVHDEIVLETDSRNAEKVAAKLKKIMEKAAKKYVKEVPIIADVSIDKDWSAK